jgi:alpha-galactosidase
MPPLKIAVLGAGSFVFGPSILSQIIFENDLGDIELALMDVDPEILRLIATIGRQMARAAHKTVQISVHTGRIPALDGAHYVICAAAAQARQRYQIDSGIIQQHIPDHLVTEFGGVAGISYSLRQIALITAIADDMKRCCPDAWLLNVANPLPRVCQAAHVSGIKTVGFCSVALNAHNFLWQILRAGPPLEYPFTDAIKHWQLTTAGVNHFAWVLELVDRHTGENLLPQIQQRIAEGATSRNPQMEAVCLETGYFLAAGDSHVRDFLEPRRTLPVPHVPFHGDDQERWNRLQQMRRIADGMESWQTLLNQVSWERPVDWIAARVTGKPASFRALNLVNEGQIPDLPNGVFVETPCIVSANKLLPQVTHLPESVRELTRCTAQVTDAIVRAALTRSRALLNESVELDPTIENKAAGSRALDACLAAHADLLPVYV